MKRESGQKIEKNTRRAVSLRVKGIVQGVGFRPFVYTLARKLDLSGFVLNDGEGVLIEIEGSSERIDRFVSELSTKAPPFSKICEISVSEIPAGAHHDFRIRESERGEKRFVLISPDLASCQDCINEMLDPSDRRHRYPFINCTNCGPRFTIIEDIPYDREKTSMKAFPMCPLCRGEFDDPLTRRFHAQPNACSTCGPRLTLMSSESDVIECDDAIARSIELLRHGSILAIKGLGGFHLACDARNDRSVRNLRERKYREDKPFALMAGDLPSIREHCYVSPAEEALLTSEKRPIVLLEKKKPELLAPQIAPVQNTLGFMLPYTPAHHLILKESGLVLVMTSANMSDEPICHDNDEAMERLQRIADYYLVHNRTIHIRCDDSVTRISGGKEMILRRSRGYVPAPLQLPWSFGEQILACGAELKSTFCLTRENMAFISHHIGDLENLETLLSYENGIEHFKRLFSINPEVIACDMHPEYLSTKYAISKESKKLIPVQHHHAHLASLLADNETDEEIIGVIFDGLGAGPDGTLWGGEFLLGDFRDFKRVAHFKPVPLPGGTKAIKEPWRMAISCLYQHFGEDLPALPLPFIRALDGKAWQNFRIMLEKGIASPLTSSAGRLFDAASAIMGIRDSINYEGQAAIELEMAATDPTQEHYSYDIQKKVGAYVINMSDVYAEMIDEMRKGLPRSYMAKKFHNTIAAIVGCICRNIRNDGGTSKVGLSGGVFQNMLLLELTVGRLRDLDFQVLTHGRVPPNDGGISLGQAVIANARCKYVLSHSGMCEEH